jgi:16S rRNA (cytosine967-C5)-methyltransferase
MAVSVSRKIAFDVLHRVEAEGAYASDVLHAGLDVGPAAAKLQPEDAALATELTMGVLRWRGLLDFLIERHTQKPVGRLDLAVAIALRMGAYQLRFLGKIPARAAVNESVELVKRARKSSAAPLVNAVLRRIAADAKSPADQFLPPGMPLAQRLATIHSHPAWMVERWLARFGELQTIALLEANDRAPRLSLSIHAPEQRDAIIRALEKSGLRIDAGALLKSAFAASGGSPARTHAFRAGQISIQDEASQAIPLLLGVRAGDRVLDLCAAPGGKTATLARAAGPSGTVVAADRHAHRLRAMAAQLKRLGLQNVQLLQLDAAHALPLREAFDRILVDAPCSGTGTLARHPEIRWRLRPEQLAELREQQKRMLGNALEKLAPGGRLLYSTCSIEPEENEDVIAHFLNNSSTIRAVPLAEAARTIAPHLAHDLPAAEFFAGDGFFRTSPSAHRTDGFFAALLEKIELPAGLRPPVVYASSP